MSMVQPKVSVIIPVYGVEKYIARCARSLFGQTLQNIEYIFVNDCTPDNSIKLLCEVLEQYPQRKEQVAVQELRRDHRERVGTGKVPCLRPSKGLFPA